MRPMFGQMRQRRALNSPRLIVIVIYERGRRVQITAICGYRMEMQDVA